jgi:hypothetical protein
MLLGTSWSRVLSLSLTGVLAVGTKACKTLLRERDSLVGVVSPPIIT